jgi:hypothetical protein
MRSFKVTPLIKPLKNTTVNNKFHFFPRVSRAAPQQDGKTARRQDGKTARRKTQDARRQDSKTARRKTQDASTEPGAGMEEAVTCLEIRDILGSTRISRIYTN